MENQANQNIVKQTTKGALVVSRVWKSDYQKEGTLTAELKQTVTTISKYPGKSVSNDLQSNIFGMEEFGFETKDFTQSRTDVAWIDVPANSTVESVTQKLSEFPTACIYRVMANKPIIHSGQQARLESETSENANNLYNQIANRQVLRYSDKDEQNAGKLILDNLGKPQYKATFFSNVAKEDADYRTLDQDYYASPEIHAELNQKVNVIQGQSI